MGIKINRIELNGRADRPSLAVLMYLGNENPVEALDAAVKLYVEDKGFYEFVDANMDNPWTRVILKEIEGFEKSEMIVEGRTFDLFELYALDNVRVVYLCYSKGSDLRPNPIMDFALFQLAQGSGYNAYIDSDISDIWSRLVIFGINEIPQDDFKDQKL